MSTNLESAYHMSQLAYPLLRASGAGSIVFVSSVASVVAVNIGTSIYSATKGNFILLFYFHISLRETL
jgi:Tropinone reductase 1